MTEGLKTLKDIFKGIDREIADGEYWMMAFLNFNKELRQEAVKWVKDASNPEARAIMRAFFNLTEEDLK